MSHRRLIGDQSSRLVDDYSGNFLPAIAETGRNPVNIDNFDFGDQSAATDEGEDAND